MQKKKPYIKPEIKRIELKPEDAVLTACKTAGTARRATTPPRCRSDAARCRTATQGS